MFILTSTAYPKSFSYKTTERNLFAFQMPEGSFQCPNISYKAPTKAWSLKLSSSNSNLLHWWWQERELRTQYWPCQIQWIHQLALAKAL